MTAAMCKRRNDGNSLRSGTPSLEMGSSYSWAALHLGLKSYCDSARLLLTYKSSEGELEGSNPVPSPLASTFSVCRLTSCAGMGFVINISSGCAVTQCAVSVPGCGGKCQAVLSVPSS